MLGRVVTPALLSSFFLLLPFITQATVCGVIPDSWERILNTIGFILILLLLGMVISGFFKLYEIFITGEEIVSNQLFLWLFSGVIILALIGYVVYLGAPKACDIGPHINIPLISN